MPTDKEDIPFIGAEPIDEDEAAQQTKLNDAIRLGIRPVSRQWLLVVAGKHSLGKLQRVAHDMIIGRDAGAGLVLEDEGVSRQHAKIQVLVGDVVRIVDLGSSNGVKVDGVRVKTHVIRAGERIRLGDAVLTMLQMDEDLGTLSRNLAASIERAAKTK